MAFARVRQDKYYRAKSMSPKNTFVGNMGKRGACNLKLSKGQIANNEWDFALLKGGPKMDLPKVGTSTLGGIPTGTTRNAQTSSRGGGGNRYLHKEFQAIRMSTSAKREWRFKMQEGRKANSPE